MEGMEGYGTDGTYLEMERLEGGFQKLSDKLLIDFLQLASASKSEQFPHTRDTQTSLLY
jgi:hypothetical protein